MKKLMFGLGLIFLTSCSKTTTFPSLGKVTAIESSDLRHTTLHSKNKVKRITNGVQISKIVSFVDDRQSGWHSPSSYTMPMGETTLVFYNGKTAKRILRIGANSFYTQDKMKDISRQEMQELLGLINSKD